MTFSSLITAFGYKQPGQHQALYLVLHCIDAICQFAHRHTSSKKVSAIAKEFESVIISKEDIGFPLPLIEKLARGEITPSDDDDDDDDDDDVTDSDHRLSSTASNSSGDEDDVDGDVSSISETSLPSIQISAQDGNQATKPKRPLIEVISSTEATDELTEGMERASIE